MDGVSPGIAFFSRDALGYQLFSRQCRPNCAQRPALWFPRRGVGAVGLAHVGWRGRALVPDTFSALSRASRLRLWLSFCLATTWASRAIAPNVESRTTPERPWHCGAPARQHTNCRGATLPLSLRSGARGGRAQQVQVQVHVPRERHYKPTTHCHGHFATGASAEQHARPCASAEPNTMHIIIN